ncbi:MAG: hypothetical protein HKN82_15440 [Akkermansiaceae bacterium]|nr:hypothetical protein [Akkermansiaceae bacterium]
MNKRHLKPGYVSLLAVLSLSAVLLISLTASFRSSLQSQAVQRNSQLRVDYSHREQALLQAVLTDTPNSAMKSMMANSNSNAWETDTRWRWIFENARERADGEYAVDPAMAANLGLSSDAISGNTGDGAQAHIINNVTPTTTEIASHMFYINSGTNGTGGILGTEYPETLILGDPSVAKLDRDRPIITMDKAYSDGSQYKLIPYPNVHFGYTTQGQNFLAKRNWWAFSVTYGATSAADTGVETVQKDYVLSIYEVPSQLALGSTTMTYLGAHNDGTEWANVNIQGSVYASQAETRGSIALGSLASRDGVTLRDSSAVGGINANSTDTREDYEATRSSFFPLTTSADSGLVSFIPINVGNDGFDDLSNTGDTNRASPTSWNAYSRPAMRAAMKLHVEDVESAMDQTPTRISFTYMSGGLETTEFFERGVDWPIEGTAEGDVFPFHLEATETGRIGIAVYLNRLPLYLFNNGGDSVTVNHSLSVNVNYIDSVNAVRPNIPSLATDLCVILRDSKDLTTAPPDGLGFVKGFPKGFSLVSPMRLYIADDVNVVPSGVDGSGNPIYPPISLFAPEKRFGVQRDSVNIDFEGQLNYLGKDSSAPIRPLDLKSGVDETVVPDKIRANLFTINSASQLPPITQMNWLVVIEEVSN